jgi:ubiquinone/menaquinone biosynthesis C-methylase UbiE
MTTISPKSTYVLGSTDAEHERLIRQAAILDPFTERFFRDAGIGPGQRVLDIGSGLGDVTILAARLVGPSGTVIGVDRDAGIIVRAKTRIAEAGLRNVTFVQSDLGEIKSSEPFDAIVGRFILEFVPDPQAVVCSLCELLRPGSLLAVQDACWGPFLQLTAHLPLRSKCASLIYRAFERSGANMNMELTLYRTFQEAGLPPPHMRVEVPIGHDQDFARWIYDILCSVRPQMQQQGLSCDAVGDFETLLQRLQAEAAAAKTFGACSCLVGAWSRRPGTLREASPIELR